MNDARLSVRRGPAAGHLGVFSAVRNLFVLPHFNQSALAIHIHRLRAMAAWKAATGVLA